MKFVETPDSTSIARFSYAEGLTILTVKFKNGGRYDYFDVPEDTFEDMKAASSKGKYLAHSIKGRFEYARV